MEHAGYLGRVVDWIRRRFGELKSPAALARRRRSRCVDFFAETLEVRLTPAALTLADVETVIAQAVTRASEISPNSIVAVTDREGFVLGVWDVNGGAPPTAGEIAIAVSKAGTATYLSSNQHAFSSRTAGFIVQQNFPPGVRNKPPGPLVGVNFSNLDFSDINKFKGPGSIVLFSNQPGLGIVPVPGTSLYGSPGGVPLYKDGELVGSVGVTGDGTENLQVRQRHDTDERVALGAQIGFAPDKEFRGSRVFIDGIRLPLVKGRGRLEIVAPFGSIGSPVAPYTLIASPAPFAYPTATLGGVMGEVRQPISDDPLLFDLDPNNDTINGQMRLTAAEVESILALAAERAGITRGGIRLPRGQAAQVFITVVSNPDAPGVAPTVLGTFRTPDATMFSWDVAVQKARTAVFFSSPLAAPYLPDELEGLAFSTRTVGFLAQSLYPPGIAGTQPGPLNGLQTTLSTSPADPNLPNGFTIFPGGFGLYRNGVLIGAIGVSGDGVDQDDIIGAAGTVNFLAPDSIRADFFSFQGARLPYAKFPRNPTL